MRLVTKREGDSAIAATSGRPKKRDLWVVYTEKTRLRGGGGEEAVGDRLHVRAT